MAFLRGPVRNFPLIALSVVLLHGCGVRQNRVDTHAALNAALWTKTSAEYVASTLQAYQLAQLNLDRALVDKQWTAALEQRDGYEDLPPAIVLDLDQTVLDTSRYNAHLIQGSGYHSTQEFAKWCQDFTAPAIPGAKRFIGYAVERGVVIIYNSARSESMRDCTTRNLRALGLPLPKEDRLMLNDGTPATDKTLQRARAAERYRLLLLVGDDLNDFVSGSKSDTALRRALASEHSGRWGHEWIILPNPMYGGWVDSLYEFDYSLPLDERRNRLLQRLQP